MFFFNNGDLDEFLLFVRNVNMTLEESGMLEMAAKVQYLHTHVCEEQLRQFGMLSDCVESGTPLTVEAVILGLGTYPPPVNSLSKQNRAMCRGMSKPHRSKVRRYAAHLIKLNDYLDSFPWANMNTKIGMTQHNLYIQNSMPNGYSKEEYVKGFY